MVGIMNDDEPQRPVRVTHTAPQLNDAVEVNNDGGGMPISPE